MHLNAENYIFFFLVFTSLTPVFYVSPLSTSSASSMHYNYFIIIFFTSFFYLLTKNYFFLIFLYELLVIPVFFLLKEFGHYYRKVQASYFILIWALMGSFFIFIGFLLFFFQVDYFFFNFFFFSSYNFWGIFFICLGFSVKVPLWPFHFWISRAHAEGPTNLSIFLSGVLVKLSVYGILKFLYLSPVKLNFVIFFYFALIGVIDATLKMLIQIDSKVVIAFSTTVQMNLISFIIFSLATNSLYTLNLALLNHLLTASILFFFADQILTRFNSREFFFLSGLYYYLPVLSASLVIFIINQINFPGFMGFFLDIFFLQTSLVVNTFSSFFLFFFLFVIEHLYILIFFLKILYGVSSKFSYVYFKDLSLEECLLGFYLVSTSFLLGMFPLFLDVLFV
jgi:NADH-quinone oxidoreductase subunit M